MGAQIFYLSGTGNSLHVARELAARIPEAELVPIVGALNSGRIHTTAETVGLVFPIHNLTSPGLVKRFLQRADMRSAGYIFAVATRLCSDKVFSEMDKLLAGQGKKLDACFSVQMPCTYIPLFTLPSNGEIEKMEAELQRRLDGIQACVADRRVHREKDDPRVFVMGHVLYPAITAFMFNARFPGMARSFYAESGCTGCGLCEKVCLADRIRMKDGRPEWRRDVDCVYCFACLHFCPVEAIQIKGRNTIGKGRYHHPGVNAADIAGQKR
jgi:ferredoxin